MFLRRFASQIIKEVNPYSKIKINGCLNYKIKPFDVFECQDSNKIRASLEDPTKSIENVLKMHVKDDHVVLSDTCSASEKDCCVLEIPIKADVTIKTDQNVSLTDLYCDVLDVEAKNIQTKNIHGTDIKIISTNGGKITSRGLLLGKEIRLYLENSDLSLDRVQAEKLLVKQSNGNVQVSSCYSTYSQFDCTNSCLNLKNIHKLCHINGLGSGELKMHGFSGTLMAELEDYLMNLQLSEVLGRNKITCKSDKPSIVNLATQIFENSYVKLRAIKMTLDEDLASLNLSTNGEHIRINDKTFTNHLRIVHSNEIQLGKLTWADAFNFGSALKEELKIK